MKVCFVRHGPAVAAGAKGVPDAERPLSPRGRKKTLQAMRGVRSLDLRIETIYSSPLPRALETARILARALKASRPGTAECLLPQSTPQSLLEFLKKVKGEAVALVGHEPGLSAALGLLLGTGRAEACPLKKAGVAIVTLGKRVPHPEGTLDLFLTPATLRALGR